MPTAHQQPPRKGSLPTPESEQDTDADDTEFDRLLQTEESMELLKLMGNEALKSYYRGETEVGGFG